MAVSENKITVKDLDFHYGEKQVLHALNLNIPPNKIFSVIGPANSGITTLLRAINRLSELSPDARARGDILLDGQSVYAPQVDVSELRRKVGMVFDVPAPLPMSIFDNIAYGPRLAKVRNKSVLAETVEGALRAAALWDEVKDRLRAPASSLSGGQQQRLCIARVLALKPEVILLDRPCSGLDPVSTAKIEDSLTELKERLTIVVSPHNIQQAGRVSDRVAFMLSGRLVEEGANAEIFSNPKDQRTSDYITGRFG
ncbi:MAG: phosphate ABC transporter ATP-binding protein [Oscillospiraceae bacterium]|jgi:phosphate transport system ATP-binding protein|nr:phosphate ABC transporter ATP-binding protein [Oscillospiraceae bacterium]